MKARTELFQCDGCGRKAKLPRLEKGERAPYCDCNSRAPFRMDPVSTDRMAKRGVATLFGGLRK